MSFFLPKTAKKWLSSTSALVDGVLEKNHTSAMVEALLEKIRFFFTKYKVVPLGLFQILTKIQTEPFSGLTFLSFYLGRNVKFLNLPYYIMFYQNLLKKPFFSKSDSPSAEE